MKRIDKLPRYYQIYKQLYEDPYRCQTKIAKNTPFSQSTVSTYLSEMYASSLFKGPFIFVKPAQTYHEYVYFLEVDDPVSVYKLLLKDPHIREVTAYSGDWDISVVTDVKIDFSTVGYKRIVHHGIKGVTQLSKVTSLDWDYSMKKIQNTVSTPEKKSTLYEEIPIIPWDEKGWIFYHYFKSNVRKNVMPVLRDHKIRFCRYKEWVLQLPDFAVIKPAFYPHTFPTYCVFDFLIESAYHHQLTTILGFLPSTSIFFSAGTHVTTRLLVQDRKEANDLFNLLEELKKLGYCSQYQYALSLPVSQW